MPSKPQEAEPIGARERRLSRCPELKGPWPPPRDLGRYASGGKGTQIAFEDAEVATLLQICSVVKSPKMDQLRSLVQGLS